MYIYIYIYTHYFIYILYLCVALYNLFMDIFLFFLTNVSTAFSFVFPLVCCSFIFYSICTSNEQTSSTFRWTNHNHCPQLGWRKNIYPLTKDAQPFTTKNASILHLPQITVFEISASCWWSKRQSCKVTTFMAIYIKHETIFIFSFDSLTNLNTKKMQINECCSYS